MFLPIDNQQYAQLAGCNYNTPCGMSKEMPLIYGITHLLPGFFQQLSDFGPCVLVSSFSDSSVTRQMAEKLPANVADWFSNNVDVHHARIHAIPIGFAFNVQRTEGLMIQVKEGRLDQTNLVYMNFTKSIPRRPNPRLGLYGRFSPRPYVTAKGGSGLESIPPEEFYRDLRSHAYTLSPAGAGLDCHRHWEAMALGSIPIVLRSRITTVLLGDMPALILDSWDELNEGRLRVELPKLRERFNHVCMRKLDMSYWKRVIHATVRMLRNS